VSKTAASSLLGLSPAWLSIPKREVPVGTQQSQGSELQPQDHEESGSTRDRSILTTDFDHILDVSSVIGRLLHIESFRSFIDGATMLRDMSSASQIYLSSYLELKSQTKSYLISPPSKIGLEKVADDFRDATPQAARLQAVASGFIGGLSADYRDKTAMNTRCYEPVEQAGFELFKEPGLLPFQTKKPGKTLLYAAVNHSEFTLADIPREVNTFLKEIEAQADRLHILGGLAALSLESPPSVAKRLNIQSFVASTFKTFERALQASEFDVRRPEFDGIVLAVQKKFEAVVGLLAGTGPLPERLEFWYSALESWGEARQQARDFIDPYRRIELIENTDENRVVESIIEQADDTSDFIEHEPTGETDQAVVEMVASLQIRLEQLKQNYEQLLVPYSASMTSLKKEGVGEIMHELVLGYDNSNDDPKPQMILSFDGIPKEDARDMMATLYGLTQRFARLERNDARERLSDLLARENQLVADILQTQTALREFNINGFDVIMPRLSKDTTWLAQNRLALNNLMQSKLTASGRYTTLLNSLFEANEALPVSPGNSEIDVIEDEVVSETEPIDATDAELVEMKPDMVFPIQEIEVVKQLDWEVLPNDKRDIETIRELVKHELNDTHKVDWQRIQDLLTLSKAFNGEVYRSKPGTLASRPPYFVAVIEHKEHRFAVAENPVEDNATYIVADHLVSDHWMDILALRKDEARNAGAKQLVHPSTENVATGAQLKRIMNALQDLLLVESVK
jgi:hypothetical protein